jgi:hypothetical protein
LLGEGLIFQEDNDPKHSSNVCRSYFDKKKKLGINLFIGSLIIILIAISKKGVLKRMVFCMPPQSPDLTPIEQVWDFVKSR